MKGTSVKCADPVLCYTDAKGKRIFRNFSMASSIVKGKKHIVFDCGKCLFCRKKRAYNLAARCVLHASLYKQNCFLTLTYDEKKEGYHNTFEYSDIQKFKKRLRQHCQREYGKKIEVFNVHEYGKNGKKHWHLIVFNWRPSDLERFSEKNRLVLYTSETLGRMWPFGFSTVGDVSEASAMYQAQYCEKDYKNGNSHSEKKAHSRHSGIGKPYFLKHYEQILQLGYVPFCGKKMPIPRYFQRLAHKHYCHFYDKSAFFDLPWRKALHRPFKKGEENLHIANLFSGFQKIKKERIQELEKNWEEVMSKHLIDKEEPEFLKSANNAFYDLKNKNNSERF